MQHLNLSGYDVIVSASATVAKYVNAPNTPHICYCFMPTRALWQFEEFFKPSLFRTALRAVLPALRNHDFQAASRVTKFVAISQATRGYIQKYYQRDAGDPDVSYRYLTISAFPQNGGFTCWFPASNTGSGWTMPLRHSTNWACPFA